MARPLLTIPPKAQPTAGSANTRSKNMKDPFSKFLSPTSKQAYFAYDEAVIVNILLDTVDRFGNKEDREMVIQLEAAIKKVLPSRSGIDGHEFGEGKCNIYLYGPSADMIWACVEPILKNSEFNNINITLQYGLPDNPKTQEKRFTL